MCARVVCIFLPSHHPPTHPPTTHTHTHTHTYTRAHTSPSHLPSLSLSRVWMEKGVCVWVLGVLTPNFSTQSYLSELRFALHICALPHHEHDHCVRVRCRRSLTEAENDIQVKVPLHQRLQMIKQMTGCSNSEASTRIPSA